VYYRKDSTEHSVVLPGTSESHGTPGSGALEELKLGENVDMYKWSPRVYHRRDSTVGMSHTLYHRSRRAVPVCTRSQYRLEIV